MQAPIAAMTPKAPIWAHLPVQYKLGVDTAERIETVERVPIEHGSTEEDAKADAARKTPDRGGNAAQGLGYASAWCVAADLPHPQEVRHHEKDVPKRRDRPGGPCALACIGIKPKDRVQPGNCLAAVLLDHEDKHQKQAEHASQIAEGKARARNLADLFLTSQPGQLRVDEDKSEFTADEPKPERREHPVEVACAGIGEPQQSRADDIHQAEPDDPRHAPTGTVGHGTENGGKNSRDNPVHGRSPGPHRLRLRVGCILGQTRLQQSLNGNRHEEGAKDERVQHRVVGLARKVEEVPTPDPLLQTWLWHARASLFSRVEPGQDP